MQVVHAVPAYPPARGGIEAYAAGLCGALAAAGHDVEVLTTARGAGETGHDRPGGPRVRRLGAFTPPGLRGYPVLPDLPRRLWRTDADIVHAHGLHFWTADAAAAVRRLRRRPPYVLNPYYAPALTPKWRVYQRTLGRLTARADAVVVISRFEQRRLAAAGLLHGRVELLPPAVAGAGGGPDDGLLARFGLDRRQHRVVLSVGRVSRSKGLDVLVAAAARLVPAIPELRVLVVGPDWGERASLEHQVAAAGLQRHVVFSGELTDDEVRRAYRSADVFAFPSRFEAFGMVLLEAMSAGLPVVAVRDSAIPEVVDDGRTGLLVRPEDPVDLAAGLRRVLDDEALHRSLADMALAEVRTRHDHTAQAAQLAALYADLAP